MLLSWGERIFVTVFAGVDGVVCFGIEMSSATQNSDVELCYGVAIAILQNQVVFVSTKMPRLCTLCSKGPVASGTQRMLSTWAQAAGGARTNV